MFFKLIFLSVIYTYVNIHKCRVYKAYIAYVRLDVLCLSIKSTPLSPKKENY